MITYLFRKVHLHDNGVQETEHLTAVSADSEADARTIAKLDDTWARAAAGTVAVTMITRTVDKTELTQREIYERNVGHLLEEMSKVPEGYEVVAEIQDQKIIRKVEKPWEPKAGHAAVFKSEDSDGDIFDGACLIKSPYSPDYQSATGYAWLCVGTTGETFGAKTSELSAP